MITRENINIYKNLKNSKQDLIASITVFLVALPLCIGVAVASGMPPESGLLSGIIGGIVVGLLSGSPLQVSGPAAGLIVIVHDIIKMQGFEALGTIIFMAGLIQICFGVLKLGHWFRAISPAIIQGMLSGIGFTILMSQLYIMFDASPKKTFIDNIKYFPSVVQNGIFGLDNSAHHFAGLIGIATIVIIILWEYIPKKYRVIPVTLFAVIAVSILAFLFDLPIKYINISSNIIGSINWLPLNDWENLFNKDFIIDAFSIAFIASAETLFASTAVDKLNSLYKTNYNKEIFAQGVGNSLAGLIGALPVTGVIVRSAANIQAGAKTRLSAILHGVWILLFITAIPFVFKFIPSACLAAILVYTGYKLINPTMFRHIYKVSKGEFVILIITLVGILTTNLLEGILLGLFAGIVKSLYKLTSFNIEISNIDEEKKELHLVVSGNLTFLRLPQFAETIERIEPGYCVYVDFKKTGMIDHSILDLLEGWARRYSKSKGTVIIDWDVLKRAYPNFGSD